MDKLITICWFFLGITLSLLAGCGGGGGANDSTPPVITINGQNPISITKDSGFGANFGYIDEGATALDDVDGSVEVYDSSYVNLSEVGTYMVDYTATDSAGNSTTETRIIYVTEATVADTVPPVISIIGVDQVSIMQGAGYIDAGATATDNIDGSITVSSTGNVDTTKLGSYIVTYFATDSSGNTTSKTREINIIADPTELVSCIPVETGEAASEAIVFSSLTFEDHYFDAESIKEVSASSIKLDWYAADYAYSMLYRSCAPDGPYFQVGGNLTNSGYTDTGLAPTSTYYYKLRACNLSGCSEVTEEIKVITASADKSTNSTFESSVLIQLDTVYHRTLHGSLRRGEEYFNLDLSEAGLLKIETIAHTDGPIVCSLYNSNQTELSRNGDFATKNCEIATILTSGKYFIKIEGGYSYTSGAYSFKSRLILTIPSPSNEFFNQSHLTTQGDYVEIKWNAMSDDITHYELYGSSSENSEFVKLEQSLSDPLLPYYIGQKPTYLYYYKLKACNELGCSDFSDNTLRAEG